jgi:two-component system NtrC family response regulator
MTREKLPIVLVVDDEPLIRWSLSESLRQEGYDVLEAEDRRSALEAFSGAPGLDLVILDLRLPDSSDLGLLRSLRQMAPGLAVILMTAHGTPEVFEEAGREGASFIVGKPFDLDRMVELARSSIDGRQGG